LGIAIVVLYNEQHWGGGGDLTIRLLLLLLLLTGCLPFIIDKLLEEDNGVDTKEALEADTETCPDPDPDPDVLFLTPKRHLL
jgi:hypothetical protein